MKKEGKENTKKNSTLPKSYIPAWSAQAISYAIAFLVLGNITYYCTNGIGLNPGLVGVILLVSKLFDGVTDLIAAVIIERTRTRWGKGRPYVLLMVAAWIFIIMMFSTPNFGTVGKALFIFITYFMANSVCITLVNGAEPVHMARSLKNPEDSSTVLSISGLIASIAATIVGIIFPLLIANVSVTEHGWTKIALMLGIPSMILSYFRFAFIKEREDFTEAEKNTTERFGFKDMIKVVAANSHVLILVLVQILANVFSGLGSGVGTYFFQYIMGDISLGSLVGLTSIIGMLTLLFVPALIQKSSVKKVMQIGILLGLAGNIIRSVPMLPTLMLGNLLTSIAVIPTGMLLPSLLIDCMDYNEWKTGKRVEAIFGSLNAFAMKLGSGISSVLVGAVMAMTGFNAQLEVQNTATNAGIIALYAVIPAVMFLIMFLALRKYKIDEQMGQVRAELAERRAGE